MYGHEPITFKEFKGLWKRGKKSSTPLDHFSDCVNVDFDEEDLVSRPKFGSIGTSSGVAKIRSSYVYNTGSTIYFMMADDQGDLYRVNITDIDNPGVATLVVSKASGTLYGPFITINGRLYINEIAAGGNPYKGGTLSTYDGTTYRSAGGTKPSTATFNAANSGTAGNVDAGNHYFGVAYETNSGFITPITPEPAGFIAAPGNEQVTFTNIPTSGDSRVVARWLFATRVIADPGTGTNISHFIPYFIPNGRIGDNVTTTITLNFTDSQLLEDASYLFNISEMNSGPGASSLTLFHNRLVMGAGLDLDKLYISRPGDYETFDMVDGIIELDNIVVAAKDGTGVAVAGVTDVQEYRDTLYAWGVSSTYGINDNGDVPINWPTPVIIDQSVGANLNGVATVYDTGGVSIDYLLVAGRDGFYAFNGAYIKPEITWKIYDLWRELQLELQYNINPGDLYTGIMSVTNDIYNNKIYILTMLNDGVSGETISETRIMLVGDYKHTSPVDAEFYKNIKWTVWTFNDKLFIPTTITLSTRIDKTRLFLTNYIGSDLMMLNFDGPQEIDVPISSFETGYIRDDKDRFFHIGAIRVHASNENITEDILNFSLLNIDNNRVVPIPSFIVPSNTNNYTSDKRTGLLAQVASLKMESKRFDLDKVVLFVKSSYQTQPK